MNRPLESTLVLCDLDNLLLGADGNLPQLIRELLQLFRSRGGRLTLFSQRTPRAVRAILGSVRLSAPALLCGGTLSYNFAEGHGQQLCSFAPLGQELLPLLPTESGVGVALQMQDGSTRVLRMSQGLEKHLRQEWTPFLLSSPADIRVGEVLRVLLYQDDPSFPMMPLLRRSLGACAVQVERLAPDIHVLTPKCVPGAEMLAAVCAQPECAPEDVFVVAGGLPMLELVRAAAHSAAAADAPAELRLAAQEIALTDASGGAAAEILYRLVRNAEKFK